MLARNHLHSDTWVERGTVTVKCLAQGHNTMSQARGPFLEGPETLWHPEPIAKSRTLGLQSCFIQISLI